MTVLGPLGGALWLRKPKGEHLQCLVFSCRNLAEILQGSWQNWSCVVHGIEDIFSALVDSQRGARLRELASGACCDRCMRTVMHVYVRVVISACMA